MLEKLWIKCQNFSELWNNWIILFFIVASVVNHIAAVLGFAVGTASLLIGHSIVALELTKILYRRRKKYARLKEENEHITLSKVEDF